MEKLKTLWSRLLAVKRLPFLLYLLIAKSIFFSVAYPEALIILCILGFQGFTYFIDEVKVKPVEKAHKDKINELETRVNSLESRDRLERIAINTATATPTTPQAPKRMF